MPKNINKLISIIFYSTFTLAFYDLLYSFESFKELYSSWSEFYLALPSIIRNILIVMCGCTISHFFKSVGAYYVEFDFNHLIKKQQKGISVLRVSVLATIAAIQTMKLVMMSLRHFLTSYMAKAQLLNHWKVQPRKKHLSHQKLNQQNLLSLQPLNRHLHLHRNLQLQLVNLLQLLQKRQQLQRHRKRLRLHRQKQRFVLIPNVLTKS